MAEIKVADQRYQVDLVVFDKDGTLIDFHQLWAPRLQRAVKTLVLQLAFGGNWDEQRALEQALYDLLGYDPVVERLDAVGPFANSTTEEIVGIVVDKLANHGLDREVVTRRVWESLVPPLSAAPEPDEVHPVSDLVILDRLKDAGARIAVITNDDRSITEATLALLGVTDLIDILVCADDPIPPKPAPDPVLLAIDRFALDPARVMIVGDTVTDMMMGRLAGVGLVVGVLSGAGERTGLAELADVVIKSIGQIEVLPSDRTPSSACA